MKVWIGHYYQNFREWFVSWGNDKSEIYDAISVDSTSMVQLDSSGMVSFSTDFKDEDKSFVPTKEPERKKRWLILGKIGASREPTEFFRRHLKEDPDPSLGLKVFYGSYLRKAKEEVEKDENFIVWAKNKQEALEFVKSNFPNTNPNIMFQLDDVGYVNMYVAISKGELVFTPPKVDLENNDWIYLTDVE